MAITTVQQRASVISFGEEGVALYEPNGTGINTASEREQLVFGYNALDASDTTPRFARRRRFIIQLNTF